MRAWWQLRRRRLLPLWAVGLAAVVLVSLASALGYLEGLQVRGLDLLQRLQGRPLPRDVVLVAVDEAAFEGLRRRQPISRRYLASVVRGLQKSGAAVVGIDITVATPTRSPDDAALAGAIREFSDNGLSRVVLLGPLGPGAVPLGTLTLGPSVMLASPAVPVDSDGFLRRIDPVVSGPGGRPVPTLALALAARLAGLDPGELQDAMSQGRPLALPRLHAGSSLVVPGTPPVTVRAGVGWPINFVGPSGSFLTIPSDIVAAIGAGDAAPAADNPLRGRIAIVGGTFADSRDYYPTPYGLMAGIEVHANVVHMVTTRRFIRPSNWVVGLAINVVVVLVAGVVLVALRPLAGTLVCVAGAVGLGMPAARLAFDRGGHWIDFVLPVLAASVVALGSDALARRRVRHSFARYLSQDVMARGLTDAPGLRGEHREVSILVSDLRGSTTLSEQMPPEAIAAHLNEYLEAMTAAIFAHRGMINDFVGDAVMAVFGAPVDDADHAWNAVQSAVAMDRALQTLNRRWAAAGVPRLRMGIGIHTGWVFAGNIGGRDRIRYTVFGDPVNVASRVEGLNKELGTRILLTEETLAAVGGRISVSDCGPIAVEGRGDKVRVFEVLTGATRRRCQDDAPMG